MKQDFSLGKRALTEPWVMCVNFTITKSMYVGTSLMVQWLRFHPPMQGVQVQSLVRKLRSHMPWDQKTKTWNRSNIVRNSIKILKWPTLKTKYKKKKKKKKKRTSLLRLHAPNAGGTTERSHMLQQRSKILRAATKTVQPEKQTNKCYEYLCNSLNVQYGPCFLFL